MSTIGKLLNLTIGDKMGGIFLSDKGEVIIGLMNKPKNFTGEYKEWWNDEQLYTHRYYKNGELHGEYKSWYYTGRLETHCYFKNGKIIKDYLK